MKTAARPWGQPWPPGPVPDATLCTSEADLLALEQHGEEMVQHAKRVRYHLTECSHGDAKTLNAFDDLLKHFGIHDKVVAQQPITQPAGEMAVHHEE